MYAIGIFVDTNESEYIPLVWLSKSDQKTIKALTASRTGVLCFWPPYKNKSSVYLARKRCSEVEIGWPKYKYRLLGTAGSIINHN